jgi:hypothetical protein
MLKTKLLTLLFIALFAASLYNVKTAYSWAVQIHVNDGLFGTGIPSAYVHCQNQWEWWTGSDGTVGVTLDTGTYFFDISKDGYTEHNFTDVNISGPGDLYFTLYPTNWTWTNLFTTGQWDTCDRSTFKATQGMDSGAAAWKYPHIANFSGYEATFNFSVLVNEGVNWWDWQTLKRLTFNWNISNVYVSIAAEDVVNFARYPGWYWVYYGSSKNETAFTADWWNWWAVHYERDQWDYHYDTFKIYVYMPNSTRVTVEFYKDKGINGVTQLQSVTYTVPADWSSYVDITMIVDHDGAGRFTGSFSDAIKTGSYSPDLPTDYDKPAGENFFYRFMSGIARELGKILPTWLVDDISMFIGWTGPFLSLLSVFAAGISAALPFAPLIFLFYLLDAGITSVYQGSFTPIGQFVTTLYHLFAAFAQVLVTIAHAIYSFIHFW